jgi:transposase InsO family protein
MGKKGAERRENGLNARRRVRFIPAADSNHGLSVCENLLNREFQAERKLLGQRMRRFLFQNAEAGVGNSGRQTFRSGGQTIGVKG